MKTIPRVAASLILLCFMAGCGMSTKTTLYRAPAVSGITVKQEAWGFHQFAMAEFGIEIQFKSDLVDGRGVIPASSLMISDTGVMPFWSPNCTSPPPYMGYIRYEERQNQVDIRLYQRLTDVYGTPYFPEHPLNGVHKVNSIQTGNGEQNN